MNHTIATLLAYSFGPAHWDFNQLTKEEQAIVGNQSNLDEIRRMVKYELEYCSSDS